MEAPRTHWRPRFLMAAVPETLRPRLFARGSLTRALSRACGAPVTVQVLRHEWGRALPDERRRLGAGVRGRLLVREVLLLCAGQPRVYARSILPESSLTGPLERLRGLGTRPLADVLFTVPDLSRGPLEFAVLAPGEPLHERAWDALAHPPARPPHLPERATEPSPGTPLWARRSRFVRGRRPLLVTEVFPPRDRLP